MCMFPSEIRISKAWLTANENEEIPTYVKLTSINCLRFSTREKTFSCNAKFDNQVIDCDSTRVTFFTE